MTWRGWQAVSLASLLAGSAGCAGARQHGAAPANPETRQVRAAQEQSEKALEQARQAQQRASDQARRAAEAEQEVQRAQQRLAEAQDRARAEQQKARQMQAEAYDATQQASAAAQRSQRQAAAALSKQSQHLAAGEQLISGQVLRATRDQLVVSPDGGGQPIEFSITGQTQVRISGAQASAAELQQGEDARVSYVVSGTRPEALLVQVTRTPVGAGREPSPPPQGSVEPRPAPGTTVPEPGR